MMSNARVPRPEHPRPQMFRKEWINLNGEWTCEFDPGKSGMERGLNQSKGFSRKIQVPFCPESRLSGIGNTDFIEAMFYHRKIQVPREWKGKLILLHFGAVDYECSVYIDGKFAGSHVGGSVSFEFDVTGFVDDGEEHDLVVAVKDEGRSGVQAVGKQSQTFRSRGCSYTRVTGIWQTVWMECVGRGGLKSCRIVPDLDNSAFEFIPEFFEDGGGKSFSITILRDGNVLCGSVRGTANTGIPMTAVLDNARAWSPEDPFLYDIVFEVFSADGTLIDRVESYAGLRKIHIEGQRIFLNNRELFLRMVLDQGFYPDGIWTAPSDEALKRDIELSMAAGFNGARLHQKVFEERFHYWADRLGYLTWGESPSWGLLCFCQSFRDRTAFWESAWNFLSEWKKILLRDRNHPSIIAWTPANETWSCTQDTALYRRLISEISDTTRMLDPTRPVNDCSGYYHVKTDLWTVHIYRKSPEELKSALEQKESNEKTRENHAGLGISYQGQPFLNDEFGGFMFIPPDRKKFAENTWGYYGIEIKNGDELCLRIAEQVDVMLEMPELSGYCYTQLTDVEQEQNGLYNYDRTEKVDPAKLAAIFGKVPERLQGK